MKIDSEGFIKISDILASPKFQKYTLDDVLHVVDTDNKSRYTIKTDSKGDLYIRANQGHSIPIENLELKEITSASDLPEGVAIHGTFKKLWPSIKTQGLSRMSRNHIHFSIGLPSSNHVISGMRNNSDLFIYVDIEKAIADGIKFYLSRNNVVLSSGIDGIIPKDYFLYVLDASSLKPYDEDFPNIPPK